MCAAVPLQEDRDNIRCGVLLQILSSLLINWQLK